MNRSIKIGLASELLGITPQTLRRWEEKKVFLPDKIGLGGTRYYLKDRLLGHKERALIHYWICRSIFTGSKKGFSHSG